MSARYSIGIDLGTTNCALAYAALDATAQDGMASRVLEIDQWFTESLLKASPTLPSFLYLPPESASHPDRKWIAGHWAREQSLLTPGRVVQSAKSWLCAHGSDRSARFLPWGSEQVAADEKLSPVAASALLLRYLRDCWQEQMGDHAPFHEQRVTVTVPASFDAAAQKLTLDAALAAGFPPQLEVSLLEEPQAAFYRWLEHHETGATLESQLPGLKDRRQHVLIVDIGGGTSDFSLFEIAAGKAADQPLIKRVAVSEHILLGGDNIDLALAHRMEARLDAGAALSANQWGHLVARCRQLKEQALAAQSVSAAPWRVSIPGRGSSLLGATLAAEISTDEILELVLEGFYPPCDVQERPRRAQAALREWGLAYAVDTAITRHLADFLRGLPQVDAVLFNGGSLKPAKVRARLQEALLDWQPGAEPRLLDNDDESLAVARGAARYGWLEDHHRDRIEAGAAQSLYLETRPARGGAGKLMCILPRGTPREDEIRIVESGLRVRLNQPVSFRLYASTRGESDPAGAVVDFSEHLHKALPALQTIIASGDREHQQLPVELSSRLNATGLLQVECVAGEQRWPLEFQSRPAAGGDREAADPGAASAEPVRLSAGVGDELVDAALDHLRGRFRSAAAGGRQSLSPARLTTELEEILGLSKRDWNAALLRALWPALHDCFAEREHSFEHEETWASLAGLLLRPGFGVQLDEQRIDQLWEFYEDGFWYPGKAMQVNADVLWRRVAGGLAGNRQSQLGDDAEARVRQSGKKIPAEAVRLLGALERLSAPRKSSLAQLMIEQAAGRLRQGGYADPFVAALSRMLNRALLYAGPECVVASALVAEAFAQLKSFDWQDQAGGELIVLFMRAARLTGDRSLDLDARLQKQIVDKLAKSGVKPIRLVPLKEVVPQLDADRVSLFGETLPSGLVLVHDGDSGDAASA